MPHDAICVLHTQIPREPQTEPIPSTEQSQFIRRPEKNEHSENHKQDRSITDDSSAIVVVFLGCHSPSEFFTLETLDFIKH